MGRGRAKAKQVKVARQLKYNSGGTDLDRPSLSARRREVKGVGNGQEWQARPTDCSPRNFFGLKFFLSGDFPHLGRLASYR